MISDVSVFCIATMKTLFFMHLDPIVQPWKSELQKSVYMQIKCFVEFYHGVYFVKSQPL